MSSPVLVQLQLIDEHSAIEDQISINKEKKRHIVKT